MIIIIGSVVVLTGLGVGGYFYFADAHQAKTPKPLTASELKQLRVDLPTNTTNLKDGLVQFSISLQAKDTNSKQELDDMMPVVQDVINRTMRQFTKADLIAPGGYDRLEEAIQASINQALKTGQVTHVYFSAIVVQ